MADVRDPDSKKREEKARDAIAEGDAAPLKLQPGIARGIQDVAGRATGLPPEVAAGVGGMTGASAPDQAELDRTPTPPTGVVEAARARAGAETGTQPVAPYSSDAAKANFQQRFGEQGGPPGQVVMTPGGWVPGTHTQESSVKGWQPSERTLQDYETADRLQAQGLQGQSDVEAGASIARQGVLDKIQQGSQEYLQGAAKRQQMQEKIKANRLAQVQQMQKDIDDFKFDRRRIFRNMDAGGMAALAAGSLFGTLGEGFYAAAGHPGQNAFLAGLNRSIDRDIQLQGEDLAKKERGEGRARNALDALAQQMGDFNSARDALYIGQLKVYENELQKLSEQWKNTARGPQYQLALAQVMRERAAREQAFDAAQTATVAQQATEHYKPPAAVVVGGPGKDKGPSEGQKYTDQQLQSVNKYLTEQKVPERESIMRDFLSGIPAAKQSAVLQALRSGDMGTIRGAVADAFTENPQARSRFYNGLDKLMRERTGAVIKPEERDYYEKQILGTTGDARLQGTFGLLRSFDEDIQSSWDHAKSTWGAPAYDLEGRLSYIRSQPRPQTVPQNLEQATK